MTLPRRALEFATKHHFPQWIQYALYCAVRYQKERGTVTSTPSRI
jgi:hypothetical protein